MTQSFLFILVILCIIDFCGGNSEKFNLRGKQHFQQQSAPSVSPLTFTRRASENDKTICFSTKFEARMGNLMFQYAAVVGLCAKNQVKVDSCAQLVMPRYNDPDTPVPEFVDTFKISKANIEGCVLDKVYKENNGDKSTIMFDDKLLDSPSGTTLDGYLQSFKYFHPHAQSEIKKVFSFSMHVQNQSSAFIQSIRDKVTAKNTTSTAFASSPLSSPMKLVGVHVRLGDKLNNAFYNGWSLSVHYYRKAISLVQAQHVGEELAFIFFTGGSTNKKDADRDKDWTRTHLSANMTHSFHEESNNHLVALHSLSRCDIIIAAHSTFSWWAAYLSDSKDIVAPRQLYPGRIPLFVADDYYPPQWQLVSEDKAEDRIHGSNPFKKH